MNELYEFTFQLPGWALLSITIFFAITMILSLIRTVLELKIQRLKNLNLKEPQ